MKKGEFFDCRTQATLERNRENENTREQLQSDVDKFLANGGKIETCNNLGKTIAVATLDKKEKIKQLASDWITMHYPCSIVAHKAKALGIKFNLVSAERNRRMAVIKAAKGAR